ncbi:oligosaccharide flippase family protein [Curvibacter sp. APW13]|uniref:oligosaccharide flippase family protein n=1 Tax=Curvibacter sp. APW13 TaxID=3077236 RepID=UPI0028E001AA|nr:oligosaccharide flippase family protein [Curvibacter sp. APW13]MDT8992597.1 oligosaccharide flippase family protein [Curvibacter sp. APW13]
MNINTERNALWSIIDNLAQQFLSLLVFLILARLISPRDFGVIAVLHVLVTFFRQSVLDAIVLPISRTNEATDELYSWGLGICMLAATLMAAIMIGVTPWASDWFDISELRDILPWMALVVLAYGASAAFEARLIRKLAFRSLAIRSVIAVTTGGIVGIAYALEVGGVMSLVAQQVASSCVALILLIAQSHWTPNLLKGKKNWRRFSPDIYRVSATGFMGFLSSQGDTVLVSVLLGAQATGFYSFAKRLTSSVYLAFGAAVLRLSISAFATAHTDAEALKKAYLRILGTSFFLMLPMLLGLSVLIEPTIHVLFGDAWLPAASIVVLLSALYLLLVVNQVNDYLLYAINVRSAPLKRSLSQILLSIIFGWAGSQFGLAWMAAGFALATFSVWPWNQRTCNTYLSLRLSELVYCMLAPLIGAFCMVALLWLFLPSIQIHVADPGTSQIAKLGAWITFGAAIYVALHRVVIKLLPGVHDAFREVRGRE